MERGKKINSLTHLLDTLLFQSKTALVKPNEPMQELTIMAAAASEIIVFFIRNKVY